MAEMRKVIFVVVSTLETITQKLYDEFVMMHKVLSVWMTCSSRARSLFKLLGTYMLPSPM